MMGRVCGCIQSRGPRLRVCIHVRRGRVCEEIRIAYGVERDVFHLIIVTEEVGRGKKGAGSFGSRGGEAAQESWGLRGGLGPVVVIVLPTGAILILRRRRTLRYTLGSSSKEALTCISAPPPHRTASCHG